MLFFNSFIDFWRARYRAQYLIIKLNNYSNELAIKNNKLLRTKNQIKFFLNPICQMTKWMKKKMMKKNIHL